MDRIETCIAEYRAWCAKLGITTIADINRIVAEGKTNQLVNVSEIWQEQNFSEIAKQIKDNIATKRLILISGPSSSGKTSFANRLQLHLRVLGINAVAISLDDYYGDRDSMPKNAAGKSDYESLESIHYRLFNENMRTLIAGKEASLPVFDFQRGVSVPDARKLKLASDEIIIVEGIHGLNDKISESVPDEAKYKIYCSALQALRYDDGSRIRSRTTRLIRRLIRDRQFRNASYRATFDLWPDVEAGAEKNIYPYTDHADIIFNSSLLYELAVYRAPLDDMLATAPADDPDRATIDELLQLADSFTPISKDLVPPTSLAREFVGGSTILGQ